MNQIGKLNRKMLKVVIIIIEGRKRQISKSKLLFKSQNYQRKDLKRLKETFVTLETI